MSREALVKSLERLSLLQKVLILLGAVALITLAYWWFVFKDSWERIEPLEKEISTLESQIRKFRKESEDLPRLEKEYERQRIQLTYATTLLPENVEEIEQLLADIERLGRDVGIEFLLFSPGGETVGQHYATRKVTLKLSGPFHNLMTFFNRMSRFDRLVSLDNLNLKPRGGDQEGEVVLAADSVILVYRALSEEEIARSEQAQGNSKSSPRARKRR